MTTLGRTKEFESIPRRICHIFPAALLAGILFLAGCGGDGEPPLQRITQPLRQSTDTYSVILENMKEDGNFFKDYYHRYRILTPKKQDVTNWVKVPKNFYNSTEMLLGMALAGMKGGEPLMAAAPPGYQFVGDPRYGRWRSGRGGEYWEFEGDGPLFDELEIDIDLPHIYRHDYRSYRKTHSKGIPYFGSKNQFGTQGTYTKKRKPDFYERRMATQKVSKASFGDKVKQATIGRTRSNFRSRAGGRGK